MSSIAKNKNQGDDNTSTPYDFFQLLKPRVMSLVVFTGLIGLLLAPGPIHPLLAFTAILSIAIGSGASGAINMWYERDIDSIMKRTENRPLPQKKVHPDDALSLGIFLSICSLVILFLATNFLATLILAAAILFYVFIYTIWLKRKTPQNIVIGGAAGAFPPMIGWAAVTGDITLFPLLLFLIIFFWTPPHFWALALYKSDDYKAACIPMLPVIAGESYTKKQIIIYTLILFPLTLLPSLLGFSGAFYLGTSIILGSYFLYLTVKTYKDTGYKWAKKLFGYSILYLFLIFLTLLIDKFLIHIDVF